MRHFLAERSDIAAVDQVQDKEQLFSQLSHHPQLLIIDYNVADFISVSELAMVSKKFPETNILVISADNDKSKILEVVQLGVKGYLTKDCSKDEVMMAIQSTAKGEKFFCHKILDIIMEKSFSPEEDHHDTTNLTAREREILKFIARGSSTKQIAEDLCLSPHTVHTHRKSIIKKLKIKSPTEFVIHAMDLGLIKPN